MESTKWIQIKVTSSVSELDNICAVMSMLSNGLQIEDYSDIEDRILDGVYGDLIGSQWKRHYEVKDSGNIIPGHGGLLDRFDSALIAIPIGIIYLVAWNALCL